MEEFVGTRNCPHLGFDRSGGHPCCHADGETRTECGRFLSNPAARDAGETGKVTGIEPYYCTVLGTDSLPPEALKPFEKAEKLAKLAQRYAVRGRLDSPPERELYEPELNAETDPVIPTHTIRADSKQVMPNDKCPCGSGKKYKKCCGR